MKDLQDLFDDLKFWAKYSLQESYLMTPQRRQKALDNMNKNLELLYPKTKK